MKERYIKMVNLILGRKTCVGTYSMQDFLKFGPNVLNELNSGVGVHAKAVLVDVLYISRLDKDIPVNLRRMLFFIEAR